MLCLTSVNGNPWKRGVNEMLVVHVRVKPEFTEAFREATLGIGG